MAKYQITFLIEVSATVEAISIPDAILLAKHADETGGSTIIIKKVKGKNLESKESFNHSYPTKKRNRKAK